MIAQHGLSASLFSTSAREVRSGSRPNATRLTITVIVPTYRRSSFLLQCLAALGRQTRPADDIIVVRRRDDEETAAALKDSRCGVKFRQVIVTAPGIVHAVNTSLLSAEGSIIAFTDDDAQPWPDWLERIERYFIDDPELAGIGGRDFMHIDGVPLDTSRQPADPVVGKITWYGRHIGNHHIGSGAPREVDVLKGVNCAYRASLLKAIGLEKRLKGNGAQVDNELYLGLALRKRGFRLVYDPAICVDHFIAPRHDEDKRHSFNPLAMRNAVHNETLSLLENLPTLRRMAFLCWAFLVGTSASLGAVQWIRFMLRRDPHATAKFVASMRGRLEGWRTARGGPAAALPAPAVESS